jgi:hypothetical protein
MTNHSVLLLLGLITSFWTTERVGRRAMLIYGSLVTALANLGLGLSGSFAITPAALSASLAMSCIWVSNIGLQTTARDAHVLSGHLLLGVGRPRGVCCGSRDSHPSSEVSHYRICNRLLWFFVVSVSIAHEGVGLR